MSEHPKPAGKSVNAFLNEWWTIIVSIAGAIASILVAVGINEPLAKGLGVPFAVILIATTAYGLHRRTRRIADQQLIEERYRQLSTHSPNTAFRGLLSYGKGDVLPGEHRRREASRIATQVESAEFSFGVITGDVGVGKTSLLRSGIQPILERNGSGVYYVRHPQDLLDRIPSSMSDQPWDTRLRTALAEWMGGSLVVNTVSPVLIIDRSVLIIDQFEEFFAELTELSSRQELGSFLVDPYPRFTMKVLCAVRHDYLIHMHDLTPALNEPLSTRSTFRVPNFDEAQAADVIRECANIDQLLVSADLVTMIATDLAMGGPVRPPELQVVCTALGDSLTLEHYRAAGGAKGILSEHVRNALALCHDSELGKRLLRVLCDFEASPPIKARPKTFRELVLATGALPEMSGKLQWILNQFQTERLVVSSPDAHKGFAYSLVHDYLVTPIGFATSEISTRTEQANQALRLYFAQRGADPKTVITLRQYRFIKRHAAAELLETHAARQILRASRKAYLKWSAGLISLFGVITFALLIGWNTKEEVKQETVGMQFPNVAGNDELNIEVAFSSSGESVVTGPSSDSVVKFWNPISGDSLAAARAGKWEIERSNFLIRPSNGVHELLDIATGRKQRIPIPALPHRAVLLSDLDSVLTIFDVDSTFSSYSTLATATLHLWSVKSGPIASVPHVRLAQPFVAAEGRRVVLWSRQGERSRPVLWKTDAAQGQSVYQLVVDSMASPSSWLPDVDERLGRLVTCEVRPPVIWVHLWDLESGDRIQSRSLLSKGFERCRAQFNDAGTAILLSSSELQSSDLAFVLDIPDLALLSHVPRAGVLWVHSDRPDSRSSLAWGDRNGAVVFWNSNAKSVSPVTLRGLALRDVQSLTLNAGEVFLLAQLREGSGYQVWNVHTGERVIVLGRESRVRVARFAERGDVLNGTDEKNWVSLYDLHTGQRMNWFNVMISDGQIFTYDPSCERVHVWTSGGVVIRYIRGYNIPFFGFYPTRSCGSSNRLPSHPKL